MEGQNAKFECEIKYIGALPDLQWFKGVREIFPVAGVSEKKTKKFELQQNGNTFALVVHDCFGEDADEYRLILILHFLFWNFFFVKIKIISQSIKEYPDYIDIQ